MDVLVEIAPDVCGPCILVDKKGVKQLLVQCLNALHGTVVASLLCYKKFTESPSSVGFELNPHDPCIANKTVAKTQMTACFHVNDCKLSHHKKKENDCMIKWSRQECESIFEDGTGEMEVSRGKIHTCLGMRLDFTTPGQAKMTVFDCLEEMLEAWMKAEPNGDGTNASAAPDNLFKTDEDCEKLNDEKAVAFHNTVAKTSCTTERARPDTCMSIAFLTARV